MSEVPSSTPSKSSALPKTLVQRIDWPTMLFLAAIPLIALIAVPLYLAKIGWNPAIWIFSGVFAIATGISITAGYHRLFAHRSYEARAVYQWIMLLIGTSSWQGSALRWCSGHRTHHRHIDGDKDPYAITKGFWFAHMGWMFLKESTPENYNNCPDLQKSALMRIQDKYYVPLALLTGFGLPTLIGAFMSDVWGGLVIGGFLRVTLTQQVTYFVNSLAHTLGSRPYSADISARDSLVVALLTHGEGYHNYHHKFEADYRNGIGWWHWDPTKWLIFSLSMVGVTHRLRRMSKEEILKARLQVEALRLRSKGFSNEKLEALREQILQASHRIRQLQSEYKKISVDRMHLKKARVLEQRDRLRTELQLAKLEFQFAVQQWQTYLRSPVAL